MKDTKKYDENRQLRKEGYQQEDSVEHEDNAGAFSISTMSDNEANNGKGNTKRLLEKILSSNNMNNAYMKVKKNKGKHGIDGMTVEELLPFLRENGTRIKQEILVGKYRPKPVRRVEIPKPDGGIRLLGIPTVVDRVIQQAISQVLIPIYEKEFSDNSYGFRPQRSCHQAIRKCKEYIDAGYKWAVDIDLAKYFDTVNHDKLMRILSRNIEDERVLSLIRKYLQSGVMINGVIIATEEGTPQGGNISPLLSNIMLNELDKELSKRGLKFCRYADDCNIYVKSKKAAERVMESVTRFIEGELKLKVNKEKSAVDRPWKLKFLGISFYNKKEEIGIRVHPKSIKKFKEKLKAITGRNKATTIEMKILKLEQTIIGWVNYFKIADMKSLAKQLDEWLRRRIRMCYWKRWKKVKTKYKNLIKLGVDKSKAWEYSNTRKGYWRISKSPILNITLTNDRLKRQGFPTITERYAKVH